MSKRFYETSYEVCWTMTNKPRVFVLEVSRVDVRDAKRYGELRFIFTPHMRHPSIWNREYEEVILDRLSAEEFNPSVDYFVIAGQIIGHIIAATAIVNEYGHFRALMFSAPNSEYVERIIGDAHETAVDRVVQKGTQTTRGELPRDERIARRD